MNRKNYRTKKFGSWERSLTMDAEVTATGKFSALRGLKLGLQGVPFFVVNDVPALSGAQMPQTFLEVFQQALGKGAPQCGVESCNVV
jgi:hypothetical protein